MIDLFAYLPDDWSLSNLINLEPGWQANIKDDEHVAVGTGDTIPEALEAASRNALNGTYVGRLFSLGRLKANEPSIEGNSLLAALGLVKPKQPFVRRV